MIKYSNLKTTEQMFVDEIENMFLHKESISRGDFVRILGFLINKWRIMPKKPDNKSKHG